MGVLLNFVDRLSNVMSGRGTSVDKRVYNFYNFLPVEPVQAEAAYRTSWLFRKIIDIPPFDMTRAWRQWQAEDTDIEAIEEEERRLQLKAKVKRALVLARLWGGAAILIGNGDADASQELKPESTSKDGLPWLHVFSRYQLTASGQEITDPASPWFGMPDHFSLATHTTDANRLLKIHPSRVIAFVGQKQPEGSLISGSDWFWGDPIMQSISQAVENADMAQDGFAALIDEAKIDIIKIPGMMSQVGSQEYENRILERLRLSAVGKSVHRALMIDGEEEWEQRQITWAGMPDIISSYLQIVAGAADIPVTRLLGQSPKGLQSTGDGEERDYHAMIAAKQDEMLCPALDRIDELLIRSALGDRPDDVWYTFNSLERLSPKDAAEIEGKRATTVKTYADTGLFADIALSEMAKNALVESGQWPGSEAAFEAAEGEATRAEEQNEAELRTAEENAALAAAAKAGQPVQDAAPRTLYVSRKLLNGDEFLRWAKSQGFESTLAADDLHVTVAFSRQPVDWMKVGQDWHGDESGKLTVPAGGARMVEPLGDKGAVVLLFNSSALAWRHEAIREAGASWDYPEYQPHVSITYQGGGVDPSAVEPFRGKLVFGPEIFEEVVEDWEKDKG